MATSERRVSREVKINPKLNTTQLALKRHYRREASRQSIGQRIADAVGVCDPKFMRARALDVETEDGSRDKKRVRVKMSENAKWSIERSLRDGARLANHESPGFPDSFFDS